MKTLTNEKKDGIMKLMKWYVTGRQALTIHKYIGIFVLVDAFFAREKHKHFKYSSKF